MKPTTNTQQPEPVTVKFAAQRLGLSVRAVLYQISKGRLKATKFGDGVTSAWLVDAVDLERLVAERADS